MSWREGVNLFKTISLENIDECTDIYVEVFNDEPWNDGWQEDDAKERLINIFSNRKFFVSFIMFVKRLLTNQEVKTNRSVLIEEKLDKIIELLEEIKLDK